MTAPTTLSIYQSEVLDTLKRIATATEQAAVNTQQLLIQNAQAAYRQTPINITLAQTAPFVPPAVLATVAALVEPNLGECRLPL